MKCHGNTLFYVILCSAISLPSFSNNMQNKIVGLDKAAKVHGNIAADTYIQAGAFASKANAALYQNKLNRSISAPVFISQSGSYYKVLIGPLHSASQVRAVAHAALGKSVQPARIERPKPSKPVIHHQKQAVMVDKDGFYLKPPLESGLFASLDAGIYAGNKSSTMTVNNGSDFPFPASLDTYTGGKGNTPGTVGVTLGWFRETGNPWLSAYSLGLRYKYLFSNTFEGDVIQYSTADYNNYHYQWNTSSNVLLAQGKLNLKPFSLLVPYISGGIGAAFNHSSSYSESAFPGITARISPNFGGHVQTEFAWTAGVGLDYRLNSQIMLSAGYEFMSLGKVQSGPGTVEWATEHLMQPGMQSNGALFSLTYGLEQ